MTTGKLDIDTPQGLLAFSLVYDLGWKYTRVAAELEEAFGIQITRQSVSAFVRQQIAMREARQRTQDMERLGAGVLGVPSAPTGKRPADLPLLIPFCDECCYWPDQNDPSKAVRGISEIQRLFLTDAAAFRIEILETGEWKRLGGSSAALKTRQVWFTSLILDCNFHQCIAFERLRSYTYLHDQTDAIVKDLNERIAFALDRFPYHWVGDWRDNHKYGIYRYPTESRHSVVGAGDSPIVSGKRGRSNTANINHYSEPQNYVAPRELIGASRNSMPEETSSIVVEGTAPLDSEHWWAKVLRAGFESGGVGGEFTSYHFYGWFLHKNNRLSDKHADFNRVMSREFADRVMTTEDLAEEAKAIEEHKLDRNQVAWRRLKYYAPDDPLVRRINRKEHPEDWKMALTAIHAETWYDARAILVLESQVTPPTPQIVLAQDIAIECYRSKTEISNPAPVVLGVDPSRWGRDENGMVAIDARTQDVVGVAEGTGTPEAIAACLVHLVWVMGCFENGRHIAWIERQGGGDALIKVAMRGWYYREDLGVWTILPVTGQRPYYLNLGAERVAPEKQGAANERQIGFFTNETNRPRLFEAQRVAVEGSRIDAETGQPRAPGPTVLFRSARLIQQIGNLVNYGGQPKAAGKEGAPRKDDQKRHLDDLAIADAIARYMVDTIGPMRPEDSQRIRERASRGLGRPRIAPYSGGPE